MSRALDRVVTPEERTAYKRCRRQWDFGARERGNLELDADPGPYLDRAIHDALAVYYYPGMWDWQAGIVLPLVRKAFLRSLGEHPPSDRRLADLDLGVEVLERYLEWAPALDDFVPIMIDQDVETVVPDPAAAGGAAGEERGLAAPDGRRIVWSQRVDLLAADEDDASWIVTHSVAPDFRDVEDLLLDEVALTACWAWEHDYLGVTVAGTVHNEISTRLDPDPGTRTGDTATGRPGRGGYAQHDPSGGGRSVPQHRRAYGPDGEPLRLTPSGPRIEQRTAGPIRRTRILRTRTEIEGVGPQLAAECAELAAFGPWTDGGAAIYPAPGPHCADCAFRPPCLTRTAGGDATADLAAYRSRPPVDAARARLGSRLGGARGTALPP